ncbi:MAG TPA: hypothetical protein VFU05_15020 [Cyclobacteriaceae bacterium]|nr:hypothetical protein [Cyclobacteriaceae bacterium]
MKRLSSLLVLMVACSFSFATVRTVCNMPYSPGQYTDFNSAMADSNSGDTIYVHGTSTDYGIVTINKSLVVIGTGHNPDKQNPLVSKFLQITISSSDVQLIGLRVNTIYSISQSNVVIKKCRIMGSSSVISIVADFSNDWLIEGNIIESTNVSSLFFGAQPSPGTIVQNNVFLGQTEMIGGLINLSTDRTYFFNNVFLGLSGSYNTFFDVHFAEIDNNIFYYSMPNGIMFTDNFMDNNISFGSMDNSFYAPGSNNLITDPMFENYPGFSVLFDYSWDLSLDPSSLGHNHGTDATDVGVFGGIGSKFTETGEPSIAEITAFSITSPTTIAPGGTLTISVTSKRVP